ncbi:PREDICTED: uncharacterized protein LOC108967209 [Bactrocera latifrons]|uniref:uncharacterized protein LOC108967209 n=1 Tax=Bactrocera latifrons TaxID=174628 RepID=UPI0008DD0EDC|nr:PREDICTED: uncharacterized protein LOC108967209 [Bactrocera latifrons]
MSYAKLVNTCNVSTLAEQAINKPNYTPGKALKTVFKLLKRVFKSTTVSKADSNNNIQQQITSIKPQAITELPKAITTEVEASKFNASILTTCSTLSAEEYENEQNELAELATKSKSLE